MIIILTVAHQAFVVENIFHTSKSVITTQRKIQAHFILSQNDTVLY